MLDMVFATRNIARYAQTQALGAPPDATPEPAPSSATDAVITANDTASTPQETTDPSTGAGATDSGSAKNV